MLQHGDSNAKREFDTKEAVALKDTERYFVKIGLLRSLVNSYKDL